MSESVAKARARGPSPALRRAPAKAPTPAGSGARAGLSGLLRGAGPAVGLGVQRQVAVGEQGDRFEREADAAADRVNTGNSVEPSAISPVTPEALAQTAPQATEPVKQEKIPVQQPAATPEKKPEAMPVQRAEATPEKKPEPMPVQKPAAPEKKPEAMPVQKAEATPAKKPEPMPVQKTASTPEKRPETVPVQKKGSGPGPEEQKRQFGSVQKAEARPEDKEPIQKDAAEGAAPGPSMSSVASSAIASKGVGKPLEPSTRSTLESGLGTDLSGVRVHDDSTAQASARALNARAFTHGSDIWLGPGASQNDTRLMAHEATHVVQQSGGVNRMVQRASGKAPATSGPTAVASPPFTKRADKPNAYTTTLTLPPVKARFGHLYSAWATGDKLYRAAGYERGTPNQKDGIWLKQVNISPQALKPLDMDKPFDGKKRLTIKGKDRKALGYNDWIDLMRVPDWDRHGKVYPHPFEVDHMVELQAAGWPKSGAGNELSNMELLDKSSNASAGGLVRGDIATKVAAFLLTPEGKQSNVKSTKQFLAQYDIYFNKVEAGQGSATFQNWTRDEIEQGIQIKDAEPVSIVGKPGTATSFALLDPTGTAVLAEYPHKQNQASFAISGATQTKIAGLKATSISLDSNYATATPASDIGTISVAWDLPKGISVPKAANTIPIKKAAQGQYAGVLGKVPGLTADLAGASPIEFPDIDFDGNSISANGTIKPTIPLLDKLPIEARLLGRELEFGIVYSPETINFSIPGVSIDSCSIGLFYSTTRGLSAEGSLEFSIPNAAQGGVRVKINAAGEFEAGGRLQFDPGLFDVSVVNVWYRNKVWGGSGTLAINKPEKIRGIRSASITASLEGGKFSATGNVQPDIPAVESAGLTIEHDEKTGLRFSGDLAIKKDTPGIEGGSIHIEAQKPPDGDTFKVSGKGTAKPKIPGIDSTLQVTYDDGIFDASVTAAYNKGRLKGSVLVGATNRPVADGAPAGPPPPGVAGPITIYGGGSVTVVIAPWLQGTVGVRLLPQGEIELTGEIALPSTLDIFPEKSFNKNIFSIGVDIPIVGVSVAGQRIGIFANISGGLDVSAGIGPGQLQQLRLAITYNPAHEEDTLVQGDASLHVPAHAGLRLFVRGGIGAGIPIVSAEAGLEISAGLGLEGALDTGVHVDWAPAKGLTLDADASIYVEPKLKVDLSGFVTVDADLLLTTINLYEKHWQLAGFEYGSNLRFGVSFPVHYQEGQPFDLSLDKISFQVPDIDPKAMLSDLIARIA